jgi:hypothetical protein
MTMAEPKAPGALAENECRGQEMPGERIYRPDVAITHWRKLASRRNRGILRRPGKERS